MVAEKNKTVNDKHSELIILLILTLLIIVIFTHFLFFFVKIGKKTYKFI